MGIFSPILSRQEEKRIIYRSILWWTEWKPRRTGVMIQIDDPFPGSPASFLNSFPAGCITKYSPLFHQGFFYLSEFKKGDHAEQIQFLRQAMSHPHPAFPSQSPSPGKGIIPPVLPIVNVIYNLPSFCCFSFQLLPWAEDGSTWFQQLLT